MTATTHDLRRLIRARYETLGPATTVPQHAVMYEVMVDQPEHVDLPARYRPRRRIDAVAVGLWAKTDHLVHGFEIKCSRADLLAELRQPEKAAPGVAACDTWWLVLASGGLLRDDDALPPGWGVLAAHGRGLRVVRAAEVRAGHRDARVWAALLQASLRSHGSCRRLALVDHYSGTYVRGLEARLRAAESELWQHRAARLGEATEA